MRGARTHAALLAASVACGGCGGQTRGEDGASGGRGGGGGDGGRSDPIVAALLNQSSVRAVDLLFVIDNSPSMADKQEILAAAVPDLIDRLVNPVCVDDATGQPRPASTPADPGAPCPSPLTRAHPPVRNLHIGIVTSSLGGHGADSCSPSAPSFNPTQNEGGRLIARGPGSVPVDTRQANGFLAWTPEADPPSGFADATVLTRSFTDMVAGVGETGCGFEAPLEAWYRFLVDPDPYDRIDRVPCFDGDGSNGCAARAGTDARLLEQRRDFLRPDSLLAIIMLTDENDCSVKDDGQFFIAIQQQNPDGSLFHLPRPTDPCLQNPDDPCCFSCGQSAPDGCPQPSTFLQCQIDNGFYGGPSDMDEDAINLRCFGQKRRFGIDFLYPVDRYVKGLKSATVPDRAGNEVNNPLYSNLQGTNVVPRVPGGSDRVLLAGIVGIPWQLIDDEQESAARGTLVYKTAEEIAADGLWDAIVGPCPGREVDGQCDVTRANPNEPLMIEQVEPRPVGAVGPAGVPIVAPAAGNLANPVNGHEWNIVGRDELQYACIFPLAQPHPMAVECQRSDISLKPLCQNSMGGYGDTQFFAKAFPTLRQLEVLEGFGANSIVASICARNVDNAAAADFGYRPAIDAIAGRVGVQLRNRCLPRQLPLDDRGAPSCHVIHAAQEPQTSCGDAARGPLSPRLTEAGIDALSEAGLCDTPEICASTWSLCEITPAGGSVVDATGQLTPGYVACLTERPPAPNVSGWCYIDPAVTGTPETRTAQETLVAECPAAGRRRLRFVNEGRANHGVLMLACDPERK